jgi:hypothetical protein
VVFIPALAAFSYRANGVGAFGKAVVGGVYRTTYSVPGEEVSQRE